MPVDTPTSEAPAEEPQQTRRGVFGRLRVGLSKTRSKMVGGLRSVLMLRRALDDDLIEEIEELLFTADIGPRAVSRLCEAMHEAHEKHKLEDPGEVIQFLEGTIAAELAAWDTSLAEPTEGPQVILVVGVNGAGKTTSIAKLAGLFKGQGKRVLLAAADTFRAAAVQQLQIWADRAGVDIVRNETADPAAVTFDAIEKAVAGDYDVLIIDTAGRLHTRGNLMAQLEKMRRVISRKLPDAPHETLIVLDATTGQNALSQAIKFNEYIPLTGVILTKLDGTAKGGVVFGMRDQFDIPVKFIGIGEQMDDLLPFHAQEFVHALFDQPGE